LLCVPRVGDCGKIKKPIQGGNPQIGLSPVGW